MNEKALPLGWALASLIEVLPLEYGKALPARSRDESGDCPVYGSSGRVGRHSQAFVLGPCIVVGRKGSCGKVHFSHESCWPIDTAYFATGTGAVDLRYMYHYLDFADLDRLDSSTAIPSLSRDIYNSLSAPIPPLAEQKRIVDKIERLFSYLDEGERLLEQVQKQITTYRQAVLKAAVTGELTKEWRAANRNKVESGKELLQHILEERKNNWKGRGKYEEPLTPDTSSLPELPEGWVWSSLGALLTDDPQNGVYFPKKSYGSGCPIIRIDDFQIDWARPYEELQRVVAPPTDCIRYALNEGDFIVNRVNSLSHLGKSMCITSTHAGALFESNIMRFSVTSQIEQAYLELYLKSVIGRRRLTKNCKHAVNQASINQQDVMSTPVPLPSKDEQAYIVKKIKSNLDTSNKIDEFLLNHLRMSSRLRRSLLKSAFSGELAGQDPNDEPASELLARIHKEQKQAKASNPRSGRTTKRSVSI